jgi:hypothetical protein
MKMMEEKCGLTQQDVNTFSQSPAYLELNLAEQVLKPFL